MDVPRQKALSILPEWPFSMKLGLPITNGTDTERDSLTLLVIKLSTNVQGA